MNFNKIYIISTNLNKVFEASKLLEEIDDNFDVANTFTTNADYSDIKMSEKFIYYISEDQLNLDFRNNALLYVITDSETQESTGIAIDEYYNSKVIPTTIKSFNLIKPKYVEDCLIVWLDDNISYKSCSPIEYKINLIESKYFLNNCDKYKDRMLYFSSNEEISDCVNTILEFLNGDEDKRKQILEENC